MTAPTGREGASVPLDPYCANAQLRVVRSRWSLACNKNNSPKRKRRDYSNSRKALMTN